MRSAFSQQGQILSEIAFKYFCKEVLISIEIFSFDDWTKLKIPLTSFTNNFKSYFQNSIEQKLGEYFVKVIQQINISHANSEFI